MQTYINLIRVKKEVISIRNQEIRLNLIANRSQIWVLIVSLGNFNLEAFVLEEFNIIYFWEEKRVNFFSLNLLLICLGFLILAWSKELGLFFLD